MFSNSTDCGICGRKVIYFYYIRQVWFEQKKKKHSTIATTVFTSWKCNIYTMALWEKPCNCVEKVPVPAVGVI